jgi:2-oxoglutarate ferredoxin oxidoreductase subunit alpha
MSPTGAELYQCPVIILSDQFLASSLRTFDKGAIDFSTVSIDRGQFLSAEDLERLEDGYRRFAFTDSGIWPRAAPGHPEAVYATSSDEHDEYGRITEEITNRRRCRSAGASTTSGGGSGRSRGCTSACCWRTGGW